MKRNRSAGFTLIELMMVVLIASVLGAISVSTYTTFVTKGKRAEGRAALVELLQQQERYMTQKNTYMPFAVGAEDVPFKTYSGGSPSKATYRIGAEACESTSINECVRLTAVPQFSDPGVGSIIATSIGSRTCTGTAQQDCWR